MSMKKADIIQAFKASIAELTGQLGNELDLILSLAVLAYSRFKPRHDIATITLIANQSVYDAPEGLIGFKSHDWGRAHRRRRDPWNSPKVVKIPDVKVVPGDNGQRPFRLALEFSPTAEELAICGASMTIFFTREHRVSDLEVGQDGATTIPESDLDALLLQMQVQALRKLALKRIGKSVIKDPVTKISRSGQPAELAIELEKQFERMVAA